MIPPVLMVINVKNPKYRLFLPLPLLLLWPILLPIHLLFSMVIGCFIGVKSQHEKLIRGVESTWRTFSLPAQLRGTYIHIVQHGHDCTVSLY